MNDIVIRVEGLCKRYRIGKLQPYKALRDTLTDAFYAPFRAALTILSKRRKTDDAPKSNITFWALNNISFEVKSGEVVGIIGRNGAGKSTLLKVLSRIIEPTDGYAEIQGRVGSLLEVGTGFHPELTGRENIFLNGAILGMTRQEINSKFDEIVGFAEVEKFLDTPVKRYSSGMFVRLAFSVAAHMEPDILLVDEVLAVGDIAFQKKCLGKMQNVAKEGRTVLLVSHNMGAIRSLCDNAIWIDEGCLKKSGKVNDVVTVYENQNRYSSNDTNTSLAKRDTNDISKSEFYISSVEIFDQHGKNSNNINFNEKMVIIVDIEGSLPTRAYNLEFRVHSTNGHFVGMGSSAFHGMILDQSTKQVEIEIGPIMFTNGRYTVSFSVVDSLGGKRYDDWFNCFDFYITGCSPFGFGHELQQNMEGICALQHSIAPIKESREKIA